LEDKIFLFSLKKKRQKMKRLLRKLREKATCELEEREDEKELEDMMGKVEMNQMIKENNSGHSLKPKKVTICQEFNLTKPKVKKIRFIEKVEKKPEIKKVNIKNTKNLRQIEKEKLKRKETIKSQTLVEHSKVKKPKLKSESRYKKRKSKNITKVQTEEEKHQFEIKYHIKKKHNIDPKIHDRELFLKLNKNTKGAILKEAKILEKKELEEEQKQKDFEICLRDSTEFKNWKVQKEEEEERERRQVLKERKEEFEAGLLRVKEKTQKLKENKIMNFQEIKKEKQKEAEEIKKQKIIECEKNEQKRKKVQDGRDNVKKIKKEIIIEKGMISEAVREQKNIDKERVKKSKMRELIKRKKIIQEIRECEKNLRVLLKERKSKFILWSVN
jgi:unconventional prefoldin RPB5 interactor 1